MQVLTILTVLTFCLPIFLIAQPRPPELKLEQFMWKNRLILLTAPSSEDRYLKEQKNLLSGKEDQILDRDLKIIEVLDESESRIASESFSTERAKAIRNQFSVPEDSFQIVLIGKDGTVKLRSAEPVTAAVLFSLIDSMPMRQREMREDGDRTHF